MGPSSIDDSETADQSPVGVANSKILARFGLKPELDAVLACRPFDKELAPHLEPEAALGGLTNCPSLSLCLRLQIAGFLEIFEVSRKNSAEFYRISKSLEANLGSIRSLRLKMGENRPQSRMRTTLIRMCSLRLQIDAVFAYKS